MTGDEKEKEDDVFAEEMKDQSGIHQVKQCKIVVTGGAGLIGKPLCEYLLNMGNNTVICIDDFSNSDPIESQMDSNNNMNASLLQNENFRVFECDICNREKLIPFIEKEKPDLIFHLACHPYEGLGQFCPYDVSMTTYIGTVNIVTAAIRAKSVKRFVNFSSMARYGTGHEVTQSNEQIVTSNQMQSSKPWNIIGPPFMEHFKPNPMDVYGISKVASEKMIEILCDLHGIEWCHCVPHNVYGEANCKTLSDPYRGVLLIWVNCLLRGKPFYIYGNGEQKRAPSYVHDCIPAMAKMGSLQNHDMARQVINIGAKKEYTLNELAKIVCEEFENITNRKAMPPIHIGARPCEVHEAWCSIDKSVNLLQYKDITPIREGIRKLIGWASKIAPNGLEPRYLDKLEIDCKVPVTWKEKLI